MQVHVTCRSHAHHMHIISRFTDIIKTTDIQGVSGDLKWEFTKAEGSDGLYCQEAEVLKTGDTLVWH